MSIEVLTPAITPSTRAGPSWTDLSGTIGSEITPFAVWTWICGVSGPMWSPSRFATDQGMEILRDLHPVGHPGEPDDMQELATAVQIRLPGRHTFRQGAESESGQQVIRQAHERNRHANGGSVIVSRDDDIES